MRFLALMLLLSFGPLTAFGQDQKNGPKRLDWNLAVGDAGMLHSANPGAASNRGSSVTVAYEIASVDVDGNTVTYVQIYQEGRSTNVRFFRIAKHPDIVERVADRLASGGRMVVQHGPSPQNVYKVLGIEKYVLPESRVDFVSVKYNAISGRARRPRFSGRLFELRQVLLFQTLSQEERGEIDGLKVAQLLPNGRVLAKAQYNKETIEVVVRHSDPISVGDAIPVDRVVWKKSPRHPYTIDGEERRLFTLTKQFTY